MPLDINVTAEPGFEGQVSQLANRLELLFSASDQYKITGTVGSSTHRLPDFSLWISRQGLTLLDCGADNNGLTIDFTGGVLKHRRLFGGGKSQDIAKAVGISARFKPDIVDLTGGLGRDAFVFASLGAQVHLCERNPIVFLLLEDAFVRATTQAMDDPDLAEIIKRITLQQVDSLNYLSSLSDDQLPDVIYLDPMFPARNKSARVKKDMAMFHKLLGTETDADKLLTPAREKARYRVVVKRPLHAPFLADTEPAYSRKGKSTRFDIYTNKKLPESK